MSLKHFERLLLNSNKEAGFVLEKISISQASLDAYRKDLHLDDDLNSRVTDYFILQLKIGDQTRCFHPMEIIDVIKMLDGSDFRTRQYFRTKRPTKFRHNPLKGLWHQHYFLPQHMLQNCLNEMESGKMDGKLGQIFEEHNNEKMTPLIVGKIAHLAVLGSYQNRSDRKRLTGEWIIYSEFEGKRYFLGLGSHSMDGHFFLDQMIGISEHSMPKIRQLIPSLCSPSQLA